MNIKEVGELIGEVEGRWKDREEKRAHFRIRLNFWVGWRLYIYIYIYILSLEYDK